MKKPLRVMLADDHALVRAGIRALLEAIPAVEVVAETGNGREAVRLVNTHHPDVVLMDVAMPGLNGLEAAARVYKECPKVKVIMLSMHANEEYVWRALQAGARGYLLKDATATELEVALKALTKGDMYLSPAVSRHVIEDYIRRVGGHPGTLQALTARQREVLQLIAEGRTTKEIAHLLEVSVKTVETHRAQLMERLGIHDVAGLVRYAIRAGLVTLDK
jgi:DNA-binding NarL/FixJ family response regulator